MQTVIQYLLFLFTGTLCQAHASAHDPYVVCPSEMIYISGACEESQQPSEVENMEDTLYEISGKENMAIRNIHQI